ncbi:MFS transporter [Jiangella alkaliphila]|uniref:Predicted arabinose efflux permease, MFS family n=1 Tax=Jiangella alkaliphila TaxID=419479 RepID=A0A1H2IL69_9ACTN|nr:MFS transporter [Jiangella alkaliphila]SDU44771.1 Predicted arabinose efflux permease, MFS family [Jiangella alkaliphila]
MTQLDPRQARTRYLILLALRWLPSGMLLPVLTLLPLERGLTLSELGLAAAAQGLVVFLLELPTGGLSDALGRRPVLVASGLVSLAGLGLIFVADSFAVFALAFAVQGLYRALDSGPLESWYVDTVQTIDPDADLSEGLSRGGTAAGVAMGGGALLAGGLVALGPIGSVEALAVPVLVAAAFRIVSVLATIKLLAEPGQATGWRASLTAAREVPGVITGSLRLLRGSRILQALVCIELCWGIGAIAYESLTPIRMAEVLDDADRAGAIMGPAAAAAWLASAGGAALAPVISRRLGVAATAATARLAQAVFIATMTLFAGPAGLLVAFLACYLADGASSPMHMTLLHKEVTGAHRTTMVSLSSMVFQPAAAIGMLVLTNVAESASVTAAMVVGAVVIALAVPLYLPAYRAEKRAEPAADPGGPATGSVG